jgi:hypothetical protein
MARELTDDELATSGPAIIQALNDQTAGGWRVDAAWAEEYPLHNVMMADGPDRMRIQIRPARQRGRLVIGGSYPYIPGRSPRHGRIEITVAADRGPAVIAREITRRVLPEYGKLLAALLAELAEEAQMLDARNVLAERIRWAVTGARVSHGETSSEVSLDPGRSARISYRADEVSLELKWLPVDAAMKIIEIVAGIPRDRG